jgi:DNA-directed DNA polymerase III PolC
MEIAVSGEYEDKKKPAMDYWTFIAKDKIEEINKLFNLATTIKYKEPRIYYDDISKFDLIKIIGRKSNLDLVDPDDDHYVALSPSCSKGYINKAREKGFKFLACSDNVFPRPEDRGLYEVICGFNANIQTYDQFIQTDEQWLASVSRLVSEQEAIQALAYRQDIEQRSTAKLRAAKLLSPEKPASLRAMCEKGAAKLGVDLTDPIYANRLERELELIYQKEFEDYFYIIADICKFARERMVVGPARGSSAGSLVCYLLEITTIDPIPYNLIFERFIDINRADLPDIDIDFPWDKRDEVFDYVKEKYNSNNVARLGTVVMYKPRSAINEAGAALKIPKWKCEQVLDGLIEHSSGDARAENSIEDTFNQTTAGQNLIKDYPEIAISMEMEGHPRHYSQHAAGIVITEEPVHKFVAVDNKTGATQCDKKDAEDLNLLKIDALGLTQLSVINDCLDLIGLPKNALMNVSLEDQAAFDVINKGQLSGIFQFNGMSIRTAVKPLRVERFEDIVSITALARPGPLASGSVNEWVLRRMGETPVTYPHEIFEPYLRNTLGIVIYQEQVMEIGRNIGDLSWEDVSSLRKAMSKSLGAEFFNKYGDPWKAAAIKKGVPREIVNKIWDDLCSYGSWSFNRSHAVSYAMISYWCMWLKAHYPFEFGAATLTHESDQEKQIKILRELDQEGFGYIPFDPNYSHKDKWSAAKIDGEKKIVGPIRNVKGIGPRKAEQIDIIRSDLGLNWLDKDQVPEGLKKILRNPKTPIDTLYPISNAIMREVGGSLANRNIHTKPVNIIDINDYDGQEVLIAVVLTKIHPRHENEEIMIAKRGYARGEDELLDSLNLFVSDDTDTMFCKITRWDFPRIGKSIVDRGRAGKALYALKGVIKIYVTFRMMTVKQVRYLGDMDPRDEDQQKFAEAVEQGEV